MLGHTCCTVHNCMVPLASTTDCYYCSNHSHLRGKCVASDCTRLASPGKRTCDLPEHRMHENWRHLKHKSMHSMARRRDGNTPSSHASGASGDVPQAPEGAEEYEEQLFEQFGYQCDDKVDRRKKPTFLFACRWTHNEQIIVTLCGVIVAIVTMYGAESLDSTRVSDSSTAHLRFILTLPQHFVMRVYPSQLSLPAFLFYDNNCSIIKMLEAEADPHYRHYFDDCGLPVDVFHFWCKHKQSDTTCNKKCNATNWPQLIAEDGSWRFNSSRAEQTNKWLGGYQSILREMSQVRYRFLLDEMVKQRNCYTIRTLEEKGMHPYAIPRSELGIDAQDNQYCLQCIMYLSVLYMWTRIKAKTS
jgi:hypothetical protein